MGLKDLGIFAAVLVAWIVLNRWVLPWLGVPTCMSGNCGTGSTCCPTDVPPAVQQSEKADPTRTDSAERAAGTQGTELDQEQIDQYQPETVR